MGNRMDLDNATAICTEIGNKRRETFSASETELRDTVGWTGKNDLEILDSVVTKTESGVTITVTRNSKGQVTEIDADTNGNPSSARVDFYLNNVGIPIDNNKSYILNGCTGGAGNTYRLQILSSESSVVKSCENSEVAFNGSDYSGKTVHARITIYSGTTLNHVKFYPMLRDASISDPTYEPYHDNVDLTIDKKAELLDKATVGWIGKNLGEYVNKALSGNTETGFRFDNAGSGSSIVAPIENNKNYIFSKKDGVGNRFRVILFYNDPRTFTQSDTTANQLIIEQTSSHAPFEFNSGNYNYVACTFATSSAFATQDEAEAMVRLASITDSAYEMPHDSVEKILKNVDAIEGKNKLYVPSNIVSVTQNTGITFTVFRNADGELLKVRANGTNTSDEGAFFDVAWNGKENLQVVPNGNYRLSGCPEGGNRNTYEVRVQQKPDNSWLVSDYGDVNGVEFTITNNTRIAVYIIIKAGQTVTDLDFFPMITDSSITDTTFEPHYFTIKDGKANDMCKVGEHRTELIVSAITPINGKTPEFFIPWNNPDKKVASTRSFKMFDRNGGSWNELAQESFPTIQYTNENGFYLNANLTNALTANTNYTFKITWILVF